MKQVNQYDKILKENLDAVIPNLIKNLLNINIVSSEKIPDDIQHTKERKADVLLKILDREGNKFVLQIEFQVVDEPKMAHRMAEYFVMLDRKYNLPIKQFVFYLGKNKPKMSEKIERENFKFSFNLLVFNELNYNLFINSENPEEIILAILSDFKKEEAEKIVIQIIKRIEETAKSDFEIKRSYNQLRILAQLRNLEQNLINIAMDSIAKFVSIERDPFYIMGMNKGEVRGEAIGETKGETKATTKFVKNMLLESEYSIEKIAKLAGVSLSFVESIKQKFSKK